MAAISNVRAGFDTGLQAVQEAGWQRGFATLLRHENCMWWGMRKWLIHLLVELTDGQETNNPIPLYETLIQMFFGVGIVAMTIGMITTAQGAIVLVMGSELPAVWIIPVVATALWAAIFVGVALWHFGREEF